MSIYVVHTIMHSEPTNKGEVFHLTLEHDPRGAPGKDEWAGGRYQANGITRDVLVKYLRTLAKKIAAGASVKDIAAP